MHSYLCYYYCYRLLEERVGYLQAQLQKQQTDRLNTSNNTIIAENNMMSVINEDLHWLLLIACEYYGELHITTNLK